MVVSECKVCRAEIVDIVPRRVCNNCKFSAPKTKTKKVNTCVRCEHVWRSRSVGRSGICPSCLSRHWDEETPSMEASKVICQKCGIYKEKDKVVCLKCLQPRTESTYYCGISISQYTTFKEFILKYQGDDPMILSYRKVLLGDQLVKEEPSKEEEKVEEVIEPPKVQEPIKEEELTLVLPPEEELVEERSEVVMEENGEEIVEEELTPEEAIKVLDGLEWATKNPLEE